MWYKKNNYDDTARDASDTLDMKSDFRDYYEDILENRPKDAKELAMFSPNPLGAHHLQYFHSSKDDPHSHFFHEHDIKRCDKPDLSELFCIEGDCDFFSQ